MSSEYEEAWNKPEAQQWVRDVLVDMVPKLKASSFAMSLVPPEDDKIDVKYCVELGASICLDKPIIAVVMEGRSVPRKLALIADAVIACDLDSEKGREQFQRDLGLTIDALTKEMGDE